MASDAELVRKACGRLRDGVPSCEYPVCGCSLSVAMSPGFLSALLAAARAEERERIIQGLEDEAEATPCEEDAMVVADCALLVRADFSYDEADRLRDKQDEEDIAAAIRGGSHGK